MTDYTLIGLIITIIAGVITLVWKLNKAMTEIKESSSKQINELRVEFSKELKEIINKDYSQDIGLLNTEKRIQDKLQTFKDDCMEKVNNEIDVVKKDVSKSKSDIVVMTKEIKDINEKYNTIFKEIQDIKKQLNEQFKELTDLINNSKIQEIKKRRSAV